MVLGILFLSLSNADINFDTKDFTWRSYTVAKVLFTTSWIELIDKREFAKAVLDQNSETFVIYVVALVATGADDLNVHPF